MDTSGLDEDGNEPSQPENKQGHMFTEEEMDINLSIQQEHAEIPEESSSDDDTPGMVHVVARYVAGLQAVSPDIIRATHCHKALHGLGRALRGRRSGNYDRSFETTRIDQFWSHSWHGSAWRKIATMLMLSNGLWAICFGNLAALCMTILFIAGVLPGFERVPYLQVGRESYATGPWALLGGTFIAVVTCITWRCRTRVFLDVICIHQDDPRRKTAALASIGAFLKHSAALHVFWDETWAERLWCVFEAAAFLKCQAMTGSHGNLIIRPTYFAVCSACVFAGTFAAELAGIVCSYHDAWIAVAIVGVPYCVGCRLAIHSVRGYFNSVETMLTQLSTFELSQAKSHCCSVNHRSNSSQPIICDREVTTICIRKWFGSVKTFEECVRSETSKALADQLGSSSFSYLWVVLVMSPSHWAKVDQVAARLRAGELYAGAVVAVINTTYSLLIFPLIYHFLFAIAYYARRPRVSCLADELINLEVFAAVAPVAIVFIILQSLCVSSFEPLVGSIVFFLLSLVLVSVSWRCSSFTLMPAHRAHRTPMACIAPTSLGTRHSIAQSLSEMDRSSSAAQGRD